MTLGILDMNSGGEVDKWSLTAVPVWGKAASLDPWIVGALAVSLCLTLQWKVGE
jgi:hypothetical protein